MNRKALWGRLTFGIAAGLVLGEMLVRLMMPILPPSSRWPTMETDLKSRQLAGLETQVGIVFIGSSVTEAAIDPSLLGAYLDFGDVYNSSLPFSSPEIYETWFHGVILESHAPRLLVIGLPIWPPGTRQAIAVEFVSSGLKQTLDTPPIDHLSRWSVLVANRGLFSNWDLLRQWEVSRGSGIWTSSGHQTVYYEKNAGLPSTDDFSYGTPMMSDPQAEALGRLISTVRSEGGEVILMLEPGRAVGDATTDDIAKYIEWLKDKSAGWDVELLDMYSPGWDANLYADLNHFNRAGTEVFTAVVARQLSDRFPTSR